MSIAEGQELRQSYQTARRAGDYDAAIGYLMDLAALLSASPNVSRGLGGGGSQSISWNPAQIEMLIKECRKLKAAAAHASSGPFVQIPVTYQRPTDAGDYS